MVLFTFGKYDGQSVYSVWEKDPQYIIWLRKTDKLDKDMKEEITKMTKNYKDNEYFFSWGKYRNRALTDVLKEDARYIQWLRRSDFVKEKCPRLSKELLNCV